jgi:hypothetical protein
MWELYLRYCEAVKTEKRYYYCFDDVLQKPYLYAQHDVRHFRLKWDWAAGKPVFSLSYSTGDRYSSFGTRRLAHTSAGVVAIYDFEEWTGLNLAIDIIDLEGLLLISAEAF